MRRIVALAAATFGLGSCASMGAPPGGPERTTPPVLVRVTPDSGATNVRARSVVFEFDDVVNDRDIDRFFLISPREGDPRVNWRRGRVEVRPRRPFRQNTAYAVTLLPGLSDLRGNVMTEGRTVVFSTGPTMPAFVVAGRVFDWVNERVAPGALVEVIRRPDSLPYVAAADSSGQFAVGPLDEGTYTVRAMLDANRNRVLDRTEAWDTVQIVVRGTSPYLEMLAAIRDTFPPRVLTVVPRDSLTLAVSFDRSIHPDDTLTAAHFRVVAADSAPLRVARVMTKAQDDSARVARDTSARRDSAAAVIRPPADPGAPGRPPGIPGLPAPPSAGVGDPRPSRPAPLRDVIVRLDSLTTMRAAATYRLTAINVRGLLGGRRSSDRIFTMPAARRDSVPPARPGAPARPPGTVPP